MVRELCLPRRPVVRDVVTPEVELVADPLLVQARRERLRRLERAGRVLPLPLAADEQKRHARAQPREMVAAEVRDVVHWVVEVRRLTTLPAAADDGHVVDAAHAD